MMKNNSDYEEYIQLVFRKEKLRKDARNYYIDYVKEFGELLEKECALRIECIKLKKTIAFCQAKLNYGEPILRNELDSYIDSVMGEYRKELDTIIAIKDSEGRQIADIEYYKIKKLYRKLATMLHPDLNPELYKHDDIAELWDRICTAYKNNDYEELQTLDVLVAETAKKYGSSNKGLTVENIALKIELLKIEIDDIIHNDPYRYGELLRDPEAVADKKDELKSSIDAYEEYLTELQAKAAEFSIGEVIYDGRADD